MTPTGAYHALKESPEGVGFEHVEATIRDIQLQETTTAGSRVQTNVQHYVEQTDNYGVELLRMASSRTVGTPKTERSGRSGSSSIKEIAADAVEQRRSDLFQDILPKCESVRDSIRIIHAHSRRDVPDECNLSTAAFIKKKEIILSMDRDTIHWTRRGAEKGRIDTDDVVGAEFGATNKSLLIHLFLKGKGKGAKRLKRKHKTREFILPSQSVTLAWIRAIQELVRWQARVPTTGQKRRVKVVVNPHSGKRRAPKIWKEKVEPMLIMAGFDPHMEETTYGGHAVDMGKNYSPDDGFEALVFVSGDGTICEYMNGLLARPEKEWRDVVRTTPISLISAGTQNAFGIGVGIETVEAAVYCIIKRKLRPLDVVTAVGQDTSVVNYSCCGLGYGLAGDVAMASEKYRWMGTLRYEFLKVKFALFTPKKHTATIRYVPVDPQPELRQYFHIRNKGANDQFDMEDGNIYDGRIVAAREPVWDNVVDAVRNPASDANYPPERWVEESSEYIAIGMLNSVPDGIYTHPSDGNLDLLIGRKGGFFQTLKLLGLYLVGKELSSPLMDYIKVKAVVLDQNEKEYGMNIDGEVLPGPGPFRMEVVPSLFKVLSEK